MVRFVRRTIGNNHRSGWSYAVKLISEIDSSILFDGVIEFNFEIKKNESWAGFFHLPPMLGVVSNTLTYEQIFKRQDLWLHSEDNLKIIFTLSNHLAQKLRSLLPHKKIEVILHPTETPQVKFDVVAFENNDKKCLHQLGYPFRNVCGIWNVRPIKDITRTWQLPAGAGELRNLKYSEDKNSRPIFNGVQAINRMNNTDYDVFLSKNIMFSEFFYASGNNAVIDCIVRNTPFITNRHPALEEYLGKEYPLFFDNIEEVPDLVGMSLEGHYYLKSLNKEQFSGEYFKNKISSFI